MQEGRMTLKIHRRDAQVADLPQRFEDSAALEAFLSEPSQALVDDLAELEGDILILGAGGKMGPTLARLARNAAPQKRVLAVARFTEPGLCESLESHGIETISCDLLDRAAVERLPRVANVIFMAGRKFGASQNAALTWAMNVHMPAIVAETFRASRIVCFSSGNIYPLMPLGRGGATESTTPVPLGEYAQSCLGRERIFEHFSATCGTPGRLFRLNYAIETRYGVLHDIAARVWAGKSVDVTMGHVNVIWQGDANAQALRCLLHCTTPTSPINISGPEVVSVRWIAEEFGRRMGRKVLIAGEEAPSALLTNTAEAAGLFGYPGVPLTRMLDWVADWITRDQPSLNKPTKYEVLDGVF
jgi:nucleoside-diphosphate-sugar epimerase